MSREGMKEICAYTGVFGKPDVLLEPQYPAWRVPLICFTDLVFKGETMWQMRHVDLPDLPPVKRNRKVKLFWPAVFSCYQYSLYVDSTAELLVDPHELLWCLEPGSDICVFRHPHRDCLYEESREVIRLGKADPETVRRQVAHYRELGALPHSGLWAGTVILRRHTRLMQDFCRAWWCEVVNFSGRDQISFPYVVSKFGIKVSTFPGSLLANEIVSWRPWERGNLDYIRNWEVVK